MSEMETKRRGRGVRKAERTKKSLRFLPEADRGIPYIDLLNEEQVARIHSETINLLWSKGIEFRDDEAAELWEKAGADVKGHRIRIDEALLTNLLKTAPEQYTLSARNPERSVTLGGRKQILTPAYGAPNVLDLDGIRRNPTIKDFHDFAKLGHMSPSMQMSGGVICEPMDIPVPKRHLHMVYSLIRHSDKPFMGMVTARDRAEDTVEMARIVFGQDFIDKYGFKCPMGVRGRNSDNRLYKNKIGWESKATLKEGMAKTFKWIQEQIMNN